MALGRFVPTILFGIALVVAAPASAQDDWVVKASPHSVAATVDKLKTAIDGAGATVAAVVDHAAAAHQAGLELPPTTVVIFGNPKLGTPVMAANPRVGIDLPMRVLVWQDGTATQVGYLRPEAMAERYGIDPGHPSIEMMKGALAKMTDAATAE